MNRTLPLIILSFLFSVISTGQITVTQDDMPKAGDTIRTSTTMVLTGIDYESTGENYIWDFSDLPVMLQRVDTFVSIMETPLTYQLFFNNAFIYPEHQATVALQLFEFDLVPGFQVEDTYLFFKESDNDYREVGVGVRLNGIPIAIPYDEIDVVYDFPVAYGNVDSSSSGFEYSFPGLGFASSERSRTNTVDGYGTLITPYGEFQALRLKTLISQKDSVYIDTAGQGVPVYREIVEYKWLGKGFGIPLLQVIEEGLLVTATYIDSLRTSFTGLADPEAQNYDFILYPNPCDDYLSIHYELKNARDVHISILSLYGHEVYRIVLKNQSPGLYNRIVNIDAEGIVPGIYLVHFKTQDIRLIRRVVVQ